VGWTVCVISHPHTYIHIYKTITFTTITQSYNDFTHERTTTSRRVSHETAPLATTTLCYMLIIRHIIKLL